MPVYEEFWWIWCILLLGPNAHTWGREYHTSSIKIMDGALSRAISKRFEAARRAKIACSRARDFNRGKPAGVSLPSPAPELYDPTFGSRNPGRVIYEKGHTKGGVVFNSKGGETAPQQSLDGNYPFRQPHFFPKKYPGEI